MVVLGIIALIMGLVAPRAIGYFGRAKSQTAELQIRQIKSALQLMYVDTGRYPTEAEGLRTLESEPATMPGWRGPYVELEGGLFDPWGREFEYRQIDGGSVEVWSYGRDGQPGGSGEDQDIRL